MKRLFATIILLLACLIYAGAQVKVSSGSSYIDVAVKRAVAEGNDVIIDLMITSHGSWKKIIISTGNMSPSSRIYDDEGNLYQSGKSNVMMFEADGTRSYWFPELVIERDVPRKMRVIVKNVDEYATEFTKAYFHYYANRVDFVENEYIINIKNLPITR